MIKCNTRVGELIREFREAKKKMISTCDMPEIVTRLNYKQQNDCMMEDAFNRLSEKPKIFCARQMNNLIDDMSEDLFIVHSNKSSAHRTKAKTRAGTSNIADAGTKTSSSTSVNNLNELPELRPDSITDINLATTKTTKSENRNINMISSSAFKISALMPSQSNGIKVSLANLDMKSVDPVKLNDSTLGDMLEEEFEGDTVGGKENLFKSKLVHKIGSPKLDALENLGSNDELKFKTSPDLSGTTVYPLKPHDGLTENKITHTEKAMMTNTEAEQLKRFLQAENTYEGKIMCSKCRKRQ